MFVFDTWWYTQEMPCLVILTRKLQSHPMFHMFIIVNLAYFIVDKKLNDWIIDHLSNQVELPCRISLVEAIGYCVSSLEAPPLLASLVKHT